MDVVETYTDITILLARQRSGTNPLRARLASHGDIFCFEEVFSLINKASDDPLKRDTNFFTFLETYASGDVTRIFPDRHDDLFRDYLEYLRCYASESLSVVDVKYNTTHFFAEAWSENFAIPYLFHLIRRLNVRVLNIKRANYLRYVLSNEKAQLTGAWHVYPGQFDDYADASISLDPATLLSKLETCALEDAIVDAHFADYPHIFVWEYADLFDPTTGAISTPFLERVSDFLGVENTFRPASKYRKQASLTLEASIRNYQEVEDLLRDTAFEYCLLDEAAYHGARDVAPKPRRRSRTGTS
jgi:hypothetical protein